MNACIFHDTDASLHDRRVFEIVEEAYNRRESVVVFAGTEERAAEIDRFLWILRQESFIPHKIALEHDEKITVPVVILTSEWNPAGASILIVDRHCSMAYTAGFGMIHEFVDRSSPDVQDACRRRFRAYRDNKISVEYLKTGVWKGAGG